MKGIGATFGLLVEYAVAVGKGVYNTIVGYFRYTWETVKNIGSLIWDIAKNPQGAGAAVRRVRTADIQGNSQKNTWMRQNTDPGWVYDYDAWTEPLPQVA